jgi:hypothetical protein
MMANLLQKWLKTLHEPMRSTKRLPQIFQMPHVGKSSKRKIRRRGRAALSTSSADKQDLEMSTLKRTSRTKLFRKSTKKSSVSQDSSTSSDKDDTAFLYCNELFSVSTEGWVAWGHCGKWAHAEESHFIPWIRSVLPHMWGNLHFF